MIIIRDENNLWATGSKRYVPFDNWKLCRAHLSAASLTGVDVSFKHSARAGPNKEI